MIFLGLAANYSAARILRHLFAFGTKKDSQALRQDLAVRYGSTADQVALYHSGRSAIAAALRAVADPGAKVILPGLTCIAVVRAIKAAGCVPVYCDIDPETLQYDFEALDKTLTLCYNENIRAGDQPRPVVMAQNTLGIPLDAAKLEAVVKKHHAIIIEDLAHCAGRFYADSREIGTIGAAAAMSFGKGKAIDTTCGGALIVRHPRATTSRPAPTQPNDPQPAPADTATSQSAPAETATPQLATTRPDVSQPLSRPKLSTSLRDRWYPVFGGIARTFWRIGLGKALIAAGVKLRWIERSADTELSLNTRLTHWQAKLAREQLKNLPKTPLREHYFVKDREKVLTELKTAGYDLCEIWYDTPVSPVRYALEADFPAERCPATVKVAEHIINLPSWYPEAKLAQAREIIKSYEVKL